MPEHLDIDKLVRDAGCQPRARLNMDTVAEYAEAMQQDGVTFPPVTVYYDGRRHILADGYHRVAAAERAGRRTIAADVRQGVRRDAVLHSVGANAAHGLRRSNEDKRRAVETLLRDEEWGKWSNPAVAKACGVSIEFVRQLRPQVATVATSAERTGLDGKSYPATREGANTAQTRPADSPQPVAPAPPALARTMACLACNGTAQDRKGRPCVYCAGGVALPSANLLWAYGLYAAGSQPEALRAFRSLRQMTEALPVTWEEPHAALYAACVARLDVVPGGVAAADAAMRAAHEALGQWTPPEPACENLPGVQKYTISPPGTPPTLVSVNDVPVCPAGARELSDDTERAEVAPAVVDNLSAPEENDTPKESATSIEAALDQQADAGDALARATLNLLAEASNAALDACRYDCDSARLRLSNSLADLCDAADVYRDALAHSRDALAAPDHVRDATNMVPAPVPAAPALASTTAAEPAPAQAESSPAGAAPPDGETESEYATASRFYARLHGANRTVRVGDTGDGQGYGAVYLNEDEDPVRVPGAPFGFPPSATGEAGALAALRVYAEARGWEVAL
jgi:hypothetical protein